MADELAGNIAQVFATYGFTDAALRELTKLDARNRPDAYPEEHFPDLHETLNAEDEAARGGTDEDETRSTASSATTTATKPRSSAKPRARK